MGVLLAAPRTEGRSALRDSDGTLVLASEASVLWGLELDPKLRLPADDLFMRDLIKPWAAHGVYAGGFALNNLSDTGSFFSADGRSCDSRAAEQLTRFVGHADRHGFTLVASLFSADRSGWLASAQAYRDAVQTIARMLPKRHGLVLVVGDLFGTTPWSPQCPYPLGEADKVIDLCRLIQEANGAAIVGIPANIVGPNREDGKNAEPLFYAASTVEALEQQLAHLAHKGPPGDWQRRAAMVDTEHFFCRRQAKGNVDQAVEEFVHDVARKLMAIQPPPQEAQGPPPNDLLTAEEKAEGFVPLFDGRTLEGWTTLATTWRHWLVKDGAIQCVPGGSPYPWLRSRKCYASFTLRLEYRIAARANSGVFVWAPLNARASSLGLEVQLTSGTAKGTPDAEETPGAIYNVLAPKEDASNPPDQWNRLEVACRGSKVTVTLNGRVVQDFDADKIPLLRTRLRKGVIGLQDHGGAVLFRRIQIKELGNKQ